jgi:hypothetical protein
LEFPLTAFRLDGVKRVVLVLAAFCAAAAAAGVALATTPTHAKAKALLTRCEKAVNSVHFVPLSPNTPQVAAQNRRAVGAFHKCGTDAQWLTVKPMDIGVKDAEAAWWGLATGIGDYMTYGHDVVYGHTGKSTLQRAQREKKRGLEEARHALKELH